MIVRKSISFKKKLKTKLVKKNKKKIVKKTKKKVIKKTIKKGVKKTIKKVVKKTRKKVVKKTIKKKNKKTAKKIVKKKLQKQKKDLKPKKLTKAEQKVLDLKLKTKQIKDLYATLEKDLKKVLRSVILANNAKGFILFNAIVLQLERPITQKERYTSKKIIELSGLDILTDSSLINTSVKKVETYFLEINPSSYDSVQMYLKDIGKYSLLKPKEEKELGLLTQARYRFLKGELNVKSPVAKKRILSEGLVARNKMVCSNLRLVVSIARGYKSRAKALSLLDLVQQGTDGLYKAADKFDPSKGYKFSTYATHWIRQSITREISNSTRTVRIPVHMAETLQKYQKTIVNLKQILGREPKLQEIADEMDLTTTKVNKIRSADKTMVKIDSPMGKGSDGETTYIEIIPDVDVDSPDDLASKEILKEQLDTILNTLTHRERDIIEYRHGMKAGGAKYTLEQIGKKFEVTRERIRQKEAEALEKLKKHKNIEQLKNY